jgi:Arc/MetJ-type ribon-helix-helix transcriptional regulator
MYMEKPTGTVTIPQEMMDRIKEYIKDSDFHSIDEYVVFVLEELFKDLEADSTSNTAISEDDEKKVKERLKALGYLD